MLSPQVPYRAMICSKRDGVKLDEGSDERYPLVVAISAYLASFGLNLGLGDFRFWDDVDIYETTESGTKVFDAAGSFPLRSWVEFSLLGASPSLFRLVTFISYFASSYLFFSILRRVPSVTGLQARVASILFLVAPFNSARVSMIMTFTAVTTLLFFLGWRFVLSKSVLIRVIGISALWISTTAPALQPMVLLPIAHLIFLRWKMGSSLVRALVPGLLILLPMSSEILQGLFWPAEGDYAKYYSVQITGLAKAGLLLAATFAYLALELLRSRSEKFSASNSLLVPVGLVALALGSTAYLAGGHLQSLSEWLISVVPEASDWNNRHTALLGIGLGIVGAGFTTVPISDRSRRKTTFSRGSLFAVALFVLLNFTYSVEYVRDVIERRDFVRQAEATIDLEGVQSVLIRDWSAGTNARGRIIRDAEWLFMLREAGWTGVDFVYRHQQNDCNLLPPTHSIVVASTTGRFSTLLRRQTDLWLKLEPYDEREFGVPYISTTGETAGLTCVR